MTELCCGSLATGERAFVAGQQTDELEQSAGSDESDEASSDSGSVQVRNHFSFLSIANSKSEVFSVTGDGKD